MTKRRSNLTFKGWRNNGEVDVNIDGVDYTFLGVDIETYRTRARTYKYKDTRLLAWLNLHNKGFVKEGEKLPVEPVVKEPDKPKPQVEKPVAPKPAKPSAPVKTTADYAQVASANAKIIRLTTIEFGKDGYRVVGKDGYSVVGKGKATPVIKCDKCGKPTMITMVKEKSFLVCIRRHHPNIGNRCDNVREIVKKEVKP
jgi:hypothetical protein